MQRKYFASSSDANVILWANDPPAAGNNALGDLSKICFKNSKPCLFCSSVNFESIIFLFVFIYSTYMERCLAYIIILQRGIFYKEVAA